MGFSGRKRKIKSRRVVALGEGGMVKVKEHTKW